MFVWIWILLALSASGHTQTTETGNSTATDCEAALDEFEVLYSPMHTIQKWQLYRGNTVTAGRPWDHINQFLTAFPNGTGAHRNPLLNMEATVSPANPREAMNKFCDKLNKTAQSMADVFGRCSGTSLECGQSDRPWKAVYSAPYTPGLLSAVEEMCRNSKAVDYMNSLGYCLVRLAQHRDSPWEMMEEMFQGVEENEKIACFMPYGRKFVCRYIQVHVPALFNGRSGNNIVRVCGQETLDLTMEFRSDAMRALRCAEFGDFVKRYDWLSVNYTAVN